MVIYIKKILELGLLGKFMSSQILKLQIMI